MNQIVTKRQEMLQRVAHLAENLKPNLTPRAHALLGEITATIETPQVLSRDQVSGHQSARGAVASRTAILEELRATLRIISSAANGLNPADFPDSAERFRMPPFHAKQAELLAAARAFERDMQPMKPVFVGFLNEEVVNRLPELIAEFESGTERKDVNRATRVGSTAALKKTSKAGVDLVRQLDAFVNLLLRDDPAALASWKSASRVGGKSHRKPGAQPVNVRKPETAGALATATAANPQ